MPATNSDGRRRRAIDRVEVYARRRSLAGRSRPPPNPRPADASVATAARGSIGPRAAATAARGEAGEPRLAPPPRTDPGWTGRARRIVDTLTPAISSRGDSGSKARSATKSRQPSTTTAGADASRLRPASRRRCGTTSSSAPTAATGDTGTALCGTRGSARPRRHRRTSPSPKGISSWRGRRGCGVRLLRRCHRVPHARGLAGARCRAGPLASEDGAADEESDEDETTTARAKCRPRKAIDAARGLTLQGTPAGRRQRHRTAGSGMRGCTAAAAVATARPSRPRRRRAAGAIADRAAEHDLQYAVYEVAPRTSRPPSRSGRVAAVSQPADPCPRRGDHVPGRPFRGRA